DWLAETQHAKTHTGIESQPSIAALLQDADYYTGLVGKWHCARSWEPKPGFDFWYGYQVSQYPHLGEQHFSDNGEHVVQRGHQSSLLTDQAIRFLRERPADQPFFLFVGYVNTHTPHKDQPDRLVSHYRDATFRDIPNETPAPCHGEPLPDWSNARDNHRDTLAQYYAAVTFIDEQIGRTLDQLEGEGALDDTLVVYSGDHGHLMGHHGLYTKGNGTLPQNFIEESIRIPCLLSWKNGFEGGQSHNGLVDTIDLFHTLLDAAGATPDEATAAEIRSPGASYLPMLKGHSPSNNSHGWRDAFYGEYGNARVIRTARYKLVLRYEGPNGHFPDELYDLANDPRERLNLYAHPDYNEVVKALTTRLNAHFAQYEFPELSGKNIGSQERCNPNEMWYAERS
ncbi:MAG: sulfatase-like hydrolase/transferase, partial [Candidatus Poribacteria bacterium]|nr:sulfatase-like hydrolase/transferase [Candidatus Poribacteria bacterium]